MTNGFEFKKLSPELFSEQEKYNHRNSSDKQEIKHRKKMISDL